MRLFLENKETWLGEDENKIAKMVYTFFVETVFSNFANRTITSFLMDKYGSTDNAQLVGRIYTDWMTLLTAKARPLFYVNRSVWREEQTA